MGQLVGFLLHPPFSEIGKKIGKMLKYTPLSKCFRHRWSHLYYYKRWVNPTIYQLMMATKDKYNVTEKKYGREQGTHFISKLLYLAIIYLF